MIGKYTIYHWLITMYTGLSLVICIVRRNFLLGTIGYFGLFHTTLVYKAR